MDEAVEAVELDRALDAARGGDEVGVIVLWRRLQPALLGYLRVMVGPAAEDVASETWLQAAKELRKFRGDAVGFRVWLFRTARNRALMELRGASRRAEDPADMATLAEQHGGGPAMADAAALALERLSTKWALDLIATLPKDQAEAVLLRAVAGMDAGEAARVLGKRPGAVRMASMRGLRRLAEVLAEQGNTPERSGAERDAMRGVVR